jgi:hypothetical protein
MNTEKMDRVADVMLVIFVICIPALFFLFGVGPNDPIIIKLVAVIVSLYFRFALFFIIGLKVVVSIRRRRKN